jgi:peptidoglycan/LPS O-acetylase OafA/YrhL
MKRIVLSLIVVVLILGSVALWLTRTPASFDPVELVQSGVILVIVGFALFLGVNRLGSLKRGEPAEDELSRKVLQKTAALSYYISLFIWVFMIYFKDRVTLDAEQWMSTGILAMAVTFGVVWLFVSRSGIRDE